MNRPFSSAIAWTCSLLLALIPLVALFYLLRLELFAEVARTSFGLPIHWQTVSDSQWYTLWAVTVAYLMIGLTALYFLRRAFSNFADGEYFNFSNSRDLRLFSILLFVQALATPVHLALASVILSFNHPAGQKILSISVGSNEIKVIGVALVLWVMSDLLVEASHLQVENKQFI